MLLMTKCDTTEIKRDFLEFYATLRTGFLAKPSTDKQVSDNIAPNPGLLSDIAMSPSLSTFSRLDFFTHYLGKICS